MSILISYESNSVIGKNMHKNKFIFGDASAIRKYGVQEFEDNYFWPVSDSDFDKFSRYMHNTYVELISDIKDDNLYDIALVELSFVHQLIQIFHYNYIKEYAKENEIKLLVGGDSYVYRSPDWMQLGEGYSSLKFPFGSVRRLLRKIVKNIYFNKHLPVLKILKGFLCKESIVSIGSMDPLKMSFIKQKNAFVNHCDWIDIINLKNTKTINNNSFFTENIISPFLRNVKKSDILFIRNIDFVEIAEIWKQRFNDLSGLYSGLINTENLMNILLVSDMSKPLSKLITMSLQRKKVDIFCFHHGNDACYARLALMHETTICHCNTFVTPTNGIRERYQKNYSNNIIAKRSNIKFISINSDYYSKLISMYNFRTNLNIKKIMLIGFPLNSYRYSYENNLFFYKMISLEYRLIIALKKAGYYVLYKAHPDRLNEIEGIFNDTVDEYIPHPFETVWQKADMLLFTYTSTTTFGYALTTNLPILLVDSAKKNRDTDDYKLMQSRIKILPAKVDNNMKIQFSEKSLIDTISNKMVNNFDFSYVDNILGKKYF